MELVTFNPTPIALPGDLQQVCRQYLTHRSMRVAQNTLAAYKTDLQQFVGYLAEQDITLIQTVGVAHVDGFIDAQLMGQGVKPRTAARKYESVNGLFKWAVKRDLIKAGANPFSKTEAPRFNAEKVVAPELSALLKFVHGLPGDTPDEKRDRAMLRLFLDSGLRIGGMIALDLYDENSTPRWCIRPSGVIYYQAKGGRTEETLCDEVTLQWLDEWLAVRHGFEKRNSPPSLFLTRRGTRPSRQAIDQMIKRRAEEGGLGHLHAHLLRHARIGHAMEKGDLHLANYIAGHKNKSTTANMYGAQSRERMRLRIASECSLSDVLTKEVA